MDNFRHANAISKHSTKEDSSLFSVKSTPGGCRRAMPAWRGASGGQSLYPDANEMFVSVRARRFGVCGFGDGDELGAEPCGGLRTSCNRREYCDSGAGT